MKPAFYQILLAMILVACFSGEVSALALKTEYCQLQTGANGDNYRGDVTTTTDANATINWQAAYEAYGTRPQESGTNPERQRANTKDEDPTGLLNEGMRYRDLLTGTFITRDPLGIVDGPNEYSYVVCNPWSKFDPHGLEGYWAGVGGALKGTAVGGGKMLWGSVKGLGKMAYRVNPVVNAVQLVSGNKTGYQKNYEGGIATAKAGYNLASSSEARTAVKQQAGNYWDDATSKDSEHFAEKINGPIIGLLVEAAVGAKGMDKLSKLNKLDDVSSIGGKSMKVTVGENYAAAEGHTVWRHVPAGSKRRLPDAIEGKVSPRGQSMSGLAPEERAMMHDMGMTDGSGFSSWSVDKSWVMNRQQRMGGVVMKTKAPKGSMWYNEAAKGKEAQVLVPGEIQAKVVKSTVKSK